MKYANGAQEIVSADCTKNPESIQESCGGNGRSVQKYGSGPVRLSGIIARHFRDYET